MRLLNPFAITAAILAIPLTSYGWTKTYGGEERECGGSVQQTSDRGFIVTGYTRSFGEGNRNLWLLKTDEYGDTLWTRIYGGTGISAGNSVRQTSDGGYIITGYDQPVLWLIKTDGQGVIIWDSYYGFPNTNSIGNCVLEAEDGGFVFTGILDEDLCLIKIDSLGKHQWTQLHGTQWYDEGRWVEQTADGGYIVAGARSMTSGDYTDVWLLKTDAQGDMVWSETFGDITKDYGYCVKSASDGGYVVLADGTFRPYGVGPTLIKTDYEGNMEWIHCYGPQDYEEGYSSGYAMDDTEDGGYVVTGGIGSDQTQWTDLYLIRTDSVGDTMWTKFYGDYRTDIGYSVQQTEDRGFVIVGEVGYENQDGLRSNLWLLKTNEYGDTVWFEGEPREVLVPSADTLVDTMIPTAWFKNTGTYPIQDFYCHCQIWPKGGDTIPLLSPPYHCKYLISYSLEPGDSVLVKFAEWFSDDSSRYVARFYTSKDSEPIWQTREKTVEFQGIPDVGIIEHPIVLAPAWELVNTVGQQITLRYSDFPDGLQGCIFDASGRKVDELKSVDASGTITWGDTAPTGVYFIRISSGTESAVRKVILLR